MKSGYRMATSEHRTVMRQLFWLSLALASTILVASGHGQSPLKLSEQGWYADPEIHIFAGQYWIYPTSSKPSGTGKEQPTLNLLQEELRHGDVVYPSYLLQTSLDAFSSPDLVHWTKHNHILDISHVSWAAYALWAPTIIFHHSKYYLFFGANDLQKNHSLPGGIGIAVSDKPEGPFVDALGKPLVGEFFNGAQPIDPMIYEDDDGLLYLYYGGQGHCNVGRLSADLMSVVPMQDGAMFREITPEHYVEGPFIFKRKGSYYFMWSEGSWTDSSYGVAYAMSKNPTGPFQRLGRILQTDRNIAQGPGHHSILRIPETDEWLISYHRRPLDTDDHDDRVLAIDRVKFSPNGKIEEVQMTRDGLSPIRLRKKVSKSDVTAGH